ncbi:MAG: hypothetical protein BWY14_01255 [Parcubacteria group bacterium ADurb.Bin192]|nr:MAG: hypothetical protein BWY14_01255 [Parcubacteria group bacterium ADurb.Bin192]
MATSNDKFKKLARKWVGSIGAGGVADGTVTTIPLSSSSGLPTDTAVVATIDRVDANGIATPSLEESVVGVVSGNNLVTCTRGVEGTAQAHSAGAVVEILFTNKVWGDLIDGILAEHSQAGAHTTDTISEKTADAGVTVDSLKIKDGRIAGWDGWSELTTLTRVSDTTATLSGDWTDRLQKGDKLWWKSNGVSRYNYIIGISYSAPNTTITITAGYVSAANDSRFENGQTITEPRYSKVANPQGFPGWFNVAAPVFDVNTYDNGSGGQPTTSECRMKIDGCQCTVHYHGSGVKAGTTNYISISSYSYPAVVNTTTHTAVGPLFVGTSGNIIGIISNLVYCLYNTNIDNDVVISHFSFTITYEI